MSIIPQANISIPRNPTLPSQKPHWPEDNTAQTVNRAAINIMYPLEFPNFRSICYCYLYYTSWHTFHIKVDTVQVLLTFLVFSLLCHPVLLCLLLSRCLLCLLWLLLWLFLPCTTDKCQSRYNIMTRNERSHTMASCVNEEVCHISRGPNSTTVEPRLRVSQDKDHPEK